MDVQLARAIKREQMRRAELTRPQYIRELHAKQLAFYDDKSRFKVGLAGRRGGKTALDVRGLAQAMGRHPERVSAYMGVTRESAKKLVWMPMKQLDRKYKLGLKFNKVERTIYHPNGSELWILGADKEDDIEKVRGPAYQLFVIDEAASFRAHVERLVDEAIEPALGDYRGALWLTGSPGRIKAGFYYDASTNQPGFEKWSVHRWTVLDNPFFEAPDQWLAETRKKHGWNEDHPIYRREYLGEWVEDSDARVYKFDTNRNVIDELPEAPGGWHLILAIDFGIVDPTAFVVLGYRDHDPKIYVLEATQHFDLSPSDAAEHTKLLTARYADRARPDRPATWDTIIGDTGGMGKAHAKEFQQRHQIYITPAEKTEKLAYISHMNGDMITGRVVAFRDTCKDLIRQWQILPWSTSGDRRKEKEDPAFDNHCTDAALYGWREGRQYLATPEERRIPVGTEEWFQNQADEEELEECRQEEAAKAGLWWDKFV